ncbi:MAG TPA: GGDEF domain-containing protein [Kofleriaceae bacterium]|nr:GGDEF domain-containing protein [Kofleriaceae bacterium]
MADSPIVVLRSEDFATVEELTRAREAIAAPVLFRVRRDEVAAVIAALREADDVCLLDDPPALVEHRQRALGRRTGTGFDTLTGLLDRATFGKLVRGELPHALLVVNLDHFKRHNDVLGHLVGDEMLRAVARRTRAAVPADAPVARIAGDTFAVALAAHHDARQVAAAIRGAVRSGPVHEDVRLTVSIGLVVRTAQRTYDELLRDADGSLYAAKARGRDRIVEHAEREREAIERKGDVELDGFEEMTKVLAERVADVISWRGRRVFQGLRDQADVDALTGLYTRRYLDRRLAFEVQQAHEDGTPLAVGLLDVDHFGAVNKQHGWPTGDRVLADAAARVRQTLRDSDWAARYGGEEICIVLAGVGLDVARGVLERVCQTMRATPFATTQDEPLPITVSIGCAELAHDDSVLDLVERASGKLLEAKGAGRDRVC